MAFKKFEKQMTGGAYLRFYAQYGSATISLGAVKMIGEPERVDWLYDDKTGEVAIQASANGSGYALRKSGYGKGYSISAAAFQRANNISAGKYELVGPVKDFFVFARAKDGLSK